MSTLRASTFPGPPAHPRLRYTCSACTTAFNENLDECPRCGATCPDAGWQRTRNAADAWLGRTLRGRYRLRQRVGRGSAGSVYRATRPHLDDTYAVKIIDFASRYFHHDTVEPRDRVAREVQVMCAIASPHVVEFYDFVETGQQRAAIVMEYVEGRTLAELLDQKRLRVERARQIALDIASGLGRVHESGAVHRDLKPGNVMLRDLGGSRELAQLIDFGIVDFVDRPNETVGFIGTPRYTSPEQARHERVDHRSDIYNLGALLFHMLTGRPPFEHQTTEKLLDAHAREETPSPAASAPSGGLPGELESLIVQMTAKQPDDRPESMAAVAEHLQSIETAGRSGNEPQSTRGKPEPAGFEPTVSVVRADNRTVIQFRSSHVSAESTVLEHDEPPVDTCLSEDAYVIAVEFDDRSVEVFSTVDGRRVGETHRTGRELSAVFDSDALDQ